MVGFCHQGTFLELPLQRRVSNQVPETNRKQLLEPKRANIPCLSLFPHASSNSEGKRNWSNFAVLRASISKILSKKIGSRVSGLGWVPLGLLCLLLSVYLYPANLQLRGILPGLIHHLVLFPSPPAAPKLINT